MLCYGLLVAMFFLFIAYLSFVRRVYTKNIKPLTNDIYAPKNLNGKELFKFFKKFFKKLKIFQKNKKSFQKNIQKNTKIHIINYYRAVKFSILIYKFKHDKNI